jgi:Multiubiquitin
LIAIADGGVTLTADTEYGHDRTTTADHGKVVITVNNKPVTLPKHRVTGLEVKQAAIAQGVEIELDFILTLEAFAGQPARQVADDDEITVTKHSVFTANDGDDDS